MNVIIAYDLSAARFLLTIHGVTFRIPSYVRNPYRYAQMLHRLGCANAIQCLTELELLC